MNFERAMRVMRQGGKVGRERWAGYRHGRHYLCIDDRDSLKAVFHGGKEDPALVVLSSLELMADDWVEVR